LYFGCTLDFTSRSCAVGGHDGQDHDEHRFPRTNAPITATGEAGIGDLPEEGLEAPPGFEPGMEVLQTLAAGKKRSKKR
jgi:hypothetical protein